MIKFKREEVTKSFHRSKCPQYTGRKLTLLCIVQID